MPNLAQPWPKVSHYLGQGWQPRLGHCLACTLVQATARLAARVGCQGWARVGPCFQNSVRQGFAMLTPGLPGFSQGCAKVWPWLRQGWARVGPCFRKHCWPGFAMVKPGFSRQSPMNYQTNAQVNHWIQQWFKKPYWGGQKLVLEKGSGILQGGGIKISEGRFNPRHDILYVYDKTLHFGAD